MDTINKWVVVDESSERAGYCCLAIREEVSGRLICDLAAHPLEATGIVERTKEEARLISLAPELAFILEHFVYAAETKSEPKYDDGKLYRDAKKAAYNLIDRVKGLK